MEYYVCRLYSWLWLLSHHCRRAYTVDGFSVVCRALYGKVAWVYYIYVLEYSVDFIHCFGFVCFIAGGVVDGFIGDHLLRQGSIIDNCYFNGTSFDVTGLICVTHCVTDHSLRKGSAIEPVLAGLFSTINNCVYIINGHLASLTAVCSFFACGP